MQSFIVIRGYKGGFTLTLLIIYLRMKNFYFRNRFSMFDALLKKISITKKNIFSQICMY